MADLTLDAQFAAAREMLDDYTGTENLFAGFPYSYDETVAEAERAFLELCLEAELIQSAAFEEWTNQRTAADYAALETQEAAKLDRDATLWSAWQDFQLAESAAAAEAAIQQAEAEVELKLGLAEADFQRCQTLISSRLDSAGQPLFSGAELSGFQSALLSDAMPLMTSALTPPEAETEPETGSGGGSGGGGGGTEGGQGSGGGTQQNSPQVLEIPTTSTDPQVHLQLAWSYVSANQAWLKEAHPSYFAAWAAPEGAADEIKSTAENMLADGVLVIRVLGADDLPGIYANAQSNVAAQLALLSQIPAPSVEQTREQLLATAATIDQIVTAIRQELWRLGSDLAKDHERIKQLQESIIPQITREQAENQAAIANDPNVQKLADLNAQLQQQEAELANLQAQAGADDRTKIQTLMAQLLQAQRKLELARADVLKWRPQGSPIPELYKANHDKAKTEVLAAAKEILRLKDEIRDLNLYRQRLGADQSRVQASIAQLQAEKQRLETQTAGREGLKVVYEQRLARAQAELQQWQALLPRKTAAFEQMQGQYVQALGRLGQYRNALAHREWQAQQQNPANPATAEPVQKSYRIPPQIDTPEELAILEAFAKNHLDKLGLLIRKLQEGYELVLSDEWKILYIFEDDFVVDTQAKRIVLDTEADWVWVYGVERTAEALADILAKALDTFRPNPITGKIETVGSRVVGAERIELELMKEAENRAGVLKDRHNRQLWREEIAAGVHKHAQAASQELVLSVTAEGLVVIGHLADGLQNLRRTAGKVELPAKQPPKRVDVSRPTTTRTTHFFQDSDPVKKILGAASESHPDEILEMRRAMEADGIEVVVKPGKTMAYGPNPSSGKPGQFIVSSEASYSAWLHEYRHYLDDKESGWKGWQAFSDKKTRWEWEKRAYYEEVKLMRRLGHFDIINELMELQTIEWEEFSCRTCTNDQVMTAFEDRMYSGSTIDRVMEIAFYPDWHLDKAHALYELAFRAISDHSLLHTVWDGIANEIEYKTRQGPPLGQPAAHLLLQNKNSAIEQALVESMGKWNSGQQGDFLLGLVAKSERKEFTDHLVAAFGWTPKITISMTGEIVY